MSAMTSAAPPAQNRRGYPLLAGGPPFLAAVVIAAVSAAVWSRLPERVVTHLSGGEPDGFAHPAVLVGVAIAVLAGWAGVSAWLARTATLSARALYATSLSSTVALGYLFTALLLANAAADRADDVRFPMWHLAVAAGGALLAAALGLLLPSREPAPGGPGSDTSPRTSTLGLRPGERVVWQRTVHSWLLTGLQAALLVSAVFTAVSGSGPGAWIALLASAVLLSLMTRVRVSAGAAGLFIRPALLGVPRLGVPLERIRSVEVRHTSPLKDLGGWGYRVSAGRRGFAVRSGEGLWVRQTNDKWFVVVVDDAHTAAALLGDLIAQRAGREG